MCILEQINVYHYCSHTQRVRVPSVNPACNNHVVGRDYFMGEWCPRCRWSGFLAPYEYEEYAEGVPCLGYTGKVTRKVRLDPEEFKDPKTKEQLWAGRVIYQDRMGEFRKDKRLQMYERLRTREQIDHISDFERSYFMEDDEEGVPNFNPCPDLLYVIDPDQLLELPEDELCGICKDKLRTSDDTQRCVSDGRVAILPCGHYFGQECILNWMADPATPTCPLCARRYNIIYETLPEGPEIMWPPGFLEQRDVDFSEDSGIRGLYFKLMSIYFVKIIFVAVLFVPFPWASWTNLWMLTFGAVLFYCSFIQLPQLQPVFSRRERIIQNRFALVSAVANTLELVYSQVSGVPEYSVWLRVLLSWVVLGVLLSKREFRLP